MKLSLNKKTLAEMPEALREHVLAWKNRYHKRHCSFRTATEFYPPEDAHVTMFNVLTGARATGRVAGEFAGHAGLCPGDAVPLPEGTIAAITGFFCGTPFLEIIQGEPGLRLPENSPKNK